MALVPATCAAALWSAYSPIVDGETVDYAPAFAAAYESYAAAGVVPGASNTGGTESIIEAYIAGIVSEAQSVDDFAAALASYWATIAIVPGAPAHGGLSVISVTNDAASKVAAFKSAILTTITDVDTQPYFGTLISNIETIGVAAITWTVTELMAGTPNFPQAYPETIS